MRDLVYYIAVSADGFIADPDGDFSSFPVDPETVKVLFDRYPETCPGHLREALGVTAAPRRFDTVVMGRRTHQPALDAGLTSAYPHLRQLVVTHGDLPEDPTVEQLQGDVAARVEALKAEEGQDLWLCGGADLAAQLLDQIDEIQLKVNPILLGSGTPLFRLDPAPRSLTLTATEELPGGVVLSTYRRA